MYWMLCDVLRRRGHWHCCFGHQGAHQRLPYVKPYVSAVWKFMEWSRLCSLQYRMAWVVGKALCRRRLQKWARNNRWALGGGRMRGEPCWRMGNRLSRQEPGLPDWWGLSPGPRTEAGWEQDTLITESFENRTGCRGQEWWERASQHF